MYTLIVAFIVARKPLPLDRLQHTDLEALDIIRTASFTESPTLKSLPRDRTFWWAGLFFDAVSFSCHIALSAMMIDE
jgi:hypothetical protein